MTDEEAQKLRDDLDNAKAANAFLYLSLEALAELTMKMPKITLESLALGRVPDDLQDEFRAIAKQVTEMMSSAHKCIWDEDGKPR